MSPVTAVARSAAAALLLCGCAARDPARYDVSGNVTHKGQPVAAGRIYFSPDLARNNNGPQGYAEIKNGRYDTADTGKGSPSGPVVIRIDGIGPPTANYPSGVPLFSEYIVKDDFPRESVKRDFDVPATAALKLPKRPGAAP